MLQNIISKYAPLACMDHGLLLAFYYYYVQVLSTSRFCLRTLFSLGIVSHHQLILLVLLCLGTAVMHAPFATISSRSASRTSQSFKQLSVLSMPGEPAVTVSVPTVQLVILCCHCY